MKRSWVGSRATERESWGRGTKGPRKPNRNTVPERKPLADQGLTKKKKGGKRRKSNTETKETPRNPYRGKEL